MLHTISRTANARLRVLDLAGLIVALPVAHTAYQALPAETWTPPTMALASALAIELFVWVASAWIHQLYEKQQRALNREVLRLARCFVMVALTMAALSFALKYEGLSRLFTGLYFTTALGILIAGRIASRMATNAARRRGYHVRRCAVVGSGALANEVVEAVLAHAEWGLELAGRIADDRRGIRQGDVLGSIADLPRILEEHVLDEVIFALPRERMTALDREVEHAVLSCEELGVGVSISLDVLRYSGDSRMLLGELDGMPILTFTRAPADQAALALKRAFDVLVSAAVLVFTAPVLLAAAVAIKVDSRGPVFFRQRRMGLNGREFLILKFRSMHIDAEARLEALRAHNEMSGPVFKMANDPRITRVGRWLRRTSLDEFPQFINVLRGEMSIVGPRPPLRSEVQRYERWQRRRLSVKPGITCTWQVSGRNEIDFERWMELDLEYIDRWSLWHDLAICLRTIPAVLGARGAH